MIEMEQIEKKVGPLEGIPEFKQNELAEPYFRLLMANTPQLSLEVTSKTGKKIVDRNINVEIG